jgi:hypothetical protein
MAQRLSRCAAVRLVPYTALLFLLPAGTAVAGKADVVAVAVERTGADVYRFDVTVFHGDEGWDHYADRWEVVAPDGTVLGTRVLRHPHVGEQPFTRSLSGVHIPGGTGEVTVRARDSVHGFGGREAAVELPASQAP